MYNGEIKAANSDGTFIVQYDTGLLKKDVYPEMIQSGEQSVGSTVKLTV